MQQARLWALGALWIGIAMVMPLAALEPVASAAQAPTYTIALCADGSAKLAMGCESIYL